MLLQLDKEQVECVEAPLNTHLRIIAGPGSGKTATIIHRVAFMVKQGIQPSDILMTTFTNKASREMQARLCELLGESIGKQIHCNTFHSLAFQFLSQHCEKHVPKHLSLIHI